MVLFQKERVETKEGLHAKILSIGQDILYLASHGKVKTPKHVSLPFLVKSKTGSVEIITVLNKLGHGISHSQLEEIKPGIAEVQMKAVENGTLLLSNCQLNIFTTSAFDNNDLAKETLSGNNTTHCTNGIVIHRKADSFQASQIIDDNNIKSKRRSFKAPPVPLVPYSEGKRVSPKAVALDAEQLVLSKEELIIGKMKDLLWLISRAATEDTLFPHWRKSNRFPHGQLFLWR